MKHALLLVFLLPGLTQGKEIVFDGVLDAVGTKGVRVYYPRPTGKGYVKYYLKVGNDAILHVEGKPAKLPDLRPWAASRRESVHVVCTPKKQVLWLDVRPDLKRPQQKVLRIGS
jgi:hypothetical protein